MKLTDYAALGGHMDYVKPLSEVQGWRRCPSAALAEPDSGAAGMTRLPQIALLSDGRRLHLQDGPIDLIVEARGRADEVRAAYEAAARRFTGLLDELCAELDGIAGRRREADFAEGRGRASHARRCRALCVLIASSRRWPRWQAAWPRRSWLRCWMLRRSTGSTSTMAATSRCISRAGEHFSVGLMDRPDRDGVMRDDAGSMRMIRCAASRPAAATAAASRSALPMR